MHLKWLCIPAALISLLVQTGSAQNIFLTSTDTSSQALSTYSVEPFTFGSSFNAVGGVVTVLPSPDPQKFYLVSSSATDTVVALKGRFPNVAADTRIYIGGGATAAKLTPDGRRLVVVGANGISIIDTATDRAMVTMGVLDVGSNPVDVAVSLDSTRAYVLSGSGLVTAINLSNNTVATSVSLNATGATSIAVAPTGVLYVSAQSSVVEVDPITLAIRAVIQVNGNPGPLQFTNDGRFAVARNASQSAVQGGFLLDLVARRASTTSIGFTFSDIAVVDGRTAYAISPQGTLYVLSFNSDGTISAAQAQINGTSPGQISHIIASGDLPRSRYLILSAGSYLYRLDTTTNQISDPIFLQTQGALNVVSPFVTTGTSGTTAVNLTQTVKAGTSSLPLVIWAYDQSGRPVSGASAQFTTSTSGVTLSSPTSTTGLNGLASTTVTIPANMTSGTVSVIGTVEGRSNTFTINIGDPGLPGPGTGPGGTPTTTGLQIVVGQGAAVPARFGTQSNTEGPLTVRLYDNNGNPVAGAPVTWTLLQGDGTVLPLSQATDANGFATAHFTSTAIPPGISYRTNQIQVSAGGQTVTFYVTAVQNSGPNLGFVNASVITPQTTSLTGQVGQTLAGAIQYKVVSTTDSANLPFIGLRVVSTNTDPTTGPVAQCRNVYALSDANGVVSCDLVISGQPGSTSLRAIIGSQRSFDFGLTVTVGSPANVVVISGNNTSGNPGQQVTLQAEVRDSSGNVLPNTQITWEIPSNVGVVSQGTTTDFNGRVSAVITLPQTPGSFTVRARAGDAVATFNLSTNAVAGSVSVDSGNQQIIAVGQTGSISVKVLGSNNSGLPNANVVFAVTSGSATINPTSVQTDQNGIARTTVTAGQTPGPVVITASVGSTSVTFNLTVRGAGPSFTAASIVNAAGFQPGIGPGSIAYIRVSGIAPNLRGSVTPPTIVGPLPTRLADVEVLFNNTLAPIYAVSNVNGEETVIVQVPYEVAPGNASVTIRLASGGSTTVDNVPIQALKPAVFTYVDQNGSTYAVATRPDGSYVSSTNPAHRGETLRVFATGLGQTASVPTGTNRAGVPNQTVTSQVIVGVNNAGVRLVSAETLPGTVGVYAVTLEIPADTQTGQSQPIGLAVVGSDGQAVFANGTAVPII